ncbi:MAG: DUF1015 domain-containing protein [Planctomycetes bacterium]|nr:DUF1015 domain-containing protein [Planctomycetota bacterium]MCH8258586.1 DUF1015 domain-containing protein [Planctomycetota bacterium]
MLRIKPFAALRPLPNIAAQVSSVPYDIVTTAEARQLAADNPRSFLRVLRPEIDLPGEMDPHDPAVYAAAKQNFQRLLSNGDLVREDEPKLYLYRQVINDHYQIGLVCCCHLDDYNNDIIKKHEKTRPDKEDDRTRHMLAINAQPGPVLMTYRDQPKIDKLVAQDVNNRPLFHFVAPDGVTHTVWTVDDAQPYCDVFAEVEAAYIADGHHRSASAARAAAQRRAANPNHTGHEEYNWFLTVLFPASQLTILPYNRVVTDLAGQSVQQVLKRLAEVGNLSDTQESQPDRSGVFGIYLDGSWRQLTLDEATIDRSDPIQSLDVALLQDRVLEPIFSIGDPRSDQRLDFIGGLNSSQKLVSRVHSGDAAAAFSLFPTTIQQLLSVADAGLVMPPKSTWFEPKLRSGLFIHMLD